ncbi:hypothetical protein GOQ29_02650 [Clostridium sp. D2Q-14]|uniref:hypothetical protein n=1 Tax=Anaeromonas gelatinilytica TaxID=2683194 RepID=UPI00193C171C|nr:hypothetical protein [Anaeromonas gelatinilytica]MBS4534509.1 hypothetical protein [Anaeromonas gelatinilytica]
MKALKINTLNKKLILTFLVISLIILSFSISIQAAHAERVLKSWDHVERVGYSPYNENFNYITLSYVNGYSYSTSTKNTTSSGDLLKGIYKRITYTRSYRVY